MKNKLCNLYSTHSYFFPIKLVLASLLLLSLTGCSGIFSRKPTPEVLETATQVCVNYIKAVTSGESKAILQFPFILWPEYLASHGANFTIEQYGKQLRSFVARYRADDIEHNPLLNLRIVDIRQSEDDLFFSLEKANLKAAPRITFHLRWDGAAWKLVGDNIFGSDGLFAALSAEQN